MTHDEPRRPDPDALLAATARPGRGRLKVFLGMSPGVGKTYGMLRAARRRKAEGGDVVVGVVETHGRRDTQALLRKAGIQASPQRVSADSAAVLDLVGELVSDYDTRHYAIEASEPNEVLRYLIELRGLKQGDLAEIVPQSNLSAILAGKRKISATLAGKLAKFFNISSAVFIPS